MSTAAIAKLGIDIVGNDKTAPGARSAEKRISQVGANAVRKIGDVDRAGGRMGGMRNMARTFADVERASSRAFGTSSVLGRFTQRANDFRAIGSALGSGFGRASVGMASAEAASASAGARLAETAVAGERAAAGLGAAATAGETAAVGMTEAAVATAGLGAVLGPVGIGLAATVAVMGAAAYAGYKFAAGWAYGGAALGRLSDRIGIAVEDIQKLQQAGERFGVDKDATGGALAGFAKTTNDAFNARNPQARVLMRKLGIQFRKKADGTLDYDAMLGDASRGIQAQKDPVIQSMVADELGLGAMLPLLRQGPAAVKRETDDVVAHGAVASSADIDQARQFVHDGTAIGQLGKRQTLKAQVAATGIAVPIMGSALSAGQQLTEASEDPAKRSAMLAAAGRSIGDGATAVASTVVAVMQAPAQAMNRAGAAQERAGRMMLQAAGRLSARQVDAKARQAIPLRNKLVAHGFSKADATALAANAVMESRGDYRTKERLKGGKLGPGRGLWQWTDKTRKNNFRRIMGVDVENSSEDQQIEFLKWELGHSENRGWRRAHVRGGDAGNVADGFARYVERPKAPDRDAADRRAVADQMTLKVEIDARGLPAGTRTKVTTGRGRGPAKSHAMQH